ncbi:MAG: SLC13 family permease [Firmicutes bacterium]|nr:SLC13 family permease [Bacillota bacterium]
MAQESNSANIRFYVHVVIGLFMMFAFARVFSPLGSLTPVGMQIVGVFVGAVWLWCFVGFLWPSLIALVAFGFTDYASFGQVVTTAFGNQVPALLLFSMILFGSPQHVGSTDYITRWFLTRKISNNRPFVFSFVFIFATYALSVAVNVTPSLILMWTVLHSVLKELNYKPGDKYSTLMVIGTFLGAISGQASLPFTGSTLAILNVFETASGIAMPIPEYMLLGFIFSVTVFVIYCLFMKFVFRPDVSNIANINIEIFNKNPLPPMSTLQKANFFGMLSFVFLVLLPSFLPDNFIVTELLNNLGPLGIAILVTGVMCVLKADGKPVLDFRAVAAKSMNWEIYIMVAAAITLSGALTHPSTGVTDMMIAAFNPVLGGHSAIVFFIIMLLISIVATSFAMNMIVGITLMPVLVTFGVTAGANLPAVAASSILLLHYAIILPSASAFAAMLWSNKEWLTSKDVAKYGGSIVIFAIIVSIVIIMPISLILF